MTHAPTPWAVTRNKRMSMWTIHHTKWCEKGQTSKIAAPLVSMNDDEDEANARFIVRAVNAHDALVEALHNLIILARPHFSDNVQALALSEAEAALQLARQP